MISAQPRTVASEWDYLIITASNGRQARAYRTLIDLRNSLGLINGVRNTLVVADPDGRRVGSGGSTIHCLLRILDLEHGNRRESRTRLDPKAWAETLDRLRILIVHAGGDSRRLPPYGPCGKIFVPVPGEQGGVLGTTLFDRLIPAYLKLPRPSSGRGQVVVASGDVLLDFDAGEVVFADKGITGVGALVKPNVAKHHGVYCRHEDGRVRLFLQKPSVEKQIDKDALDPCGQAILDIGILNLDPPAAVRLLGLCEIAEGGGGRRELAWGGPVAQAIETKGLDIYREICCALGRDVRYSGYVDEVRRSGTGMDGGTLRSIYRGLRSIPFRVHVVPRLRFLHFGTLQDLIESGLSLISSETSGSEESAMVMINSRASSRGSICGKDAWIEGCRIDAPLSLAGENVIAGLDLVTPLTLPRGGCLDLIEGTDRSGRKGWFFRAYSADDAFHAEADKGGRLCGLPVAEWLKALGAGEATIWGTRRPRQERTVWNGRFFPFVRDRNAPSEWLWLLDPKKATARQKEDWLSADRFSFEEMALRADLESFHSRRLGIRGEMYRHSLSRVFGPEGGLSAAEAVFLIRRAEEPEREEWIVALIREAVRCYESSRARQGLGSLEPSRILHALGTVLQAFANRADAGESRGPSRIFRAIRTGLTAKEKKCLSELGMAVVEAGPGLKAWPGLMKEAAFLHLGRTIVTRGGELSAPPRNVLRSDEIVWGRAPARLDLGGGWTDTPPYALERGGCVVNAAVNLNGQAPIQAYARVIERREIRINSIDSSTRIVVRTLQELLDYGKPGSQFALAKAALVLAGLAPGAARWPAGVKSLDDMLRHFGGGIEITTLAAIPSGSGLGTSSIMGAVLTSVIGRMIGRPLAQRELFHTVLKLEQALTTGGGWQDQIGGAVEGVKIITTERGLVPDPQIRFVPAELLDPATNGGRTLLYYTGIRRLAKNILHEVVGRYLDRDRRAMLTLQRLHAFPPMMAEALAMRDMDRFGALLNAAWKLNVDLDADHTTPVIEGLRARIEPHVLGAKLLGAGGGGFLLMACRSPKEAQAVRQLLGKNPPNDKARFFDFSVNRTGLVVTVC